jgi:hypothetical protein
MSLPSSDKFNVISIIIKRQTKDRLEEFRQYTREIESKFDEDKHDLSRRYDSTIAGLSAEDIDEVNDYFSDDYYTIEEVYAGQYRRSTLVSVYSFLEHSMNRLCRQYKLNKDLPLAVED